MSTLDSQIFLFTSTLTRLVLPKEVDTHNPRMQYANRIAIVVVMIVLVFLAAGIGNIIEFLFGAVTLSTVLAPVLLYTLVFRRKNLKSQDIGIAISLFIASMAYIYMFYFGWFQSITLTLLPAIISTILCVISLIIIKLFASSKESNSTAQL
jgi:Na+/proline symporter